MTAALAVSIETIETTLPALIDRAAQALSSARTAAEILEARDMASVAYDAAKKAGRLAKAKQAHDDLIATAYRVQADALEIDAKAKRRLADEYDAAQERGEVRKVGNVPEQNNTPTTADLGISRKEIHEAREIRDAEKADPGIVKRTLEEAIEAGEEPTRAKISRAVKPVRKPAGYRNRVEETQHDRDLRMLFGVWEAACVTARSEFLKQIQDQG